MLPKQLFKISFKYTFIRRFYQTQTQQNINVSLPPVMVKEFLGYLKPKDGEVIIDMTFGNGGHSRAILDQTSLVKVIALDRDPASYEIAQKMAEEYPGRLTPLLGLFSELPALLKELKVGQNTIDGIVFDYGCSSVQLNTPSRGFTTNYDGPLDMSMDLNRFKNQLSAKDILEKGNEDDLGRLFKIYGEEKNYRIFAAAILEHRQLYGSPKTTHELCQLIENTLGKDYENVDRSTLTHHPASKIFQALRMFVNNELNEINYGMLVARKYLKVGGRLVALTFNNLEDTIVKRHISGNMFNDVVNKQPLKYVSHSFVSDMGDIHDMLENNWQSLTPHIVCPSAMEVEDNPRCESAGLRAAVKIK